MAQTLTHSSVKSPYLTVQEVAEFLRLSTRQIRRLIAQGLLRVTRFGRSVRVHQRDLDNFVAAQNRSL